MKVENKIIVITGATRGLGLELKTQLEKTNTVICLARSAVDDGKTSFRVDVGNRSQVQAAFDKIREVYGKVDILINNAGFGMSGATEHISEEDARKIVNTNYFGVLWCCQCALGLMSEGSKIINISSASGTVPMVYRALYNSTKAAVTNLTYSLRMETASFGVPVTAIILGAIDTKFSSNRVKLNTEDARYGEAVYLADRFIDTRGTGARMSRPRTAKKIIRIAGKKYLRMHYILGLPYKIGALFQKAFPNFCLWIMSQVFHSPLLKKLMPDENEASAEESSQNGKN